MYAFFMSKIRKNLFFYLTHYYYVIILITKKITHRLNNVLLPKYRQAKLDGTHASLSFHLSP